MVKTEGTYIQVAYKNVFGYISTNSWPFFMIQRPTIGEKCAWVRSNTWRNERPVATGLDRFSSVFRLFDKCHNWQPKKFRICATATGGPVFCSWVQFYFSLFSSPANWTFKHYLEDNNNICDVLWVCCEWECVWMSMSWVPMSTNERAMSVHERAMSVHGRAMRVGMLWTSRGIRNFELKLFSFHQNGFNYCANVLNFHIAKSTNDLQLKFYRNNRNNASHGK